jgi:biopolymer transport protein ExbD
MAIGGGQQEGEIVSEINMTPLIDIMLVLLIIFMVSSSAAIESALDVQLPEAASAGAKPGEALNVTLTKEGLISVRGERIDAAALQAEIAKGLKELNSDTVVFEGDGQSTLDRAVEIMDIAKSAGAKNFSIAARLKE